MRFKVDKSHRYFLKKTARSLNLSFSILPAYVRFMLSYGYLIARAMDSVVDESDAEPKVKRIFLESVKNMICGGKRSIEGSLKSSAISGLKGDERDLVLSIDDIVGYLLSNITAQDIYCVKKLINGIFEGMMIDLEMERDDGCISDMKTLDRYTSLIGGIPALYWYDVYTNYRSDIFRDNLYSTAYKIGKALQYVNILRDMGNDIKKGRCYVPAQYLKEKNLTLEDLKKPANLVKIKDFIRSIIIISVDYLDKSEKFISSIDISELTMRISVVWPIYWAMDTLYLVWQNNPLASKVKISSLAIYKTLLKSPLLLSNSFFCQGYRFRREVLMLSINSQS
ncbi:MAG: squalene/phytoene synthase family protein [Elusimicrobiales bacterium]